MDETARGAWLDFLLTQGLAYLRAHIKYPAQAKFEIVRIEEETQDRVRIQFLRGRPGTTKKIEFIKILGEKPGNGQEIRRVDSDNHFLLKYWTVREIWTL